MKYFKLLSFLFLLFMISCQQKTADAYQIKKLNNELKDISSNDLQKTQIIPEYYLLEKTIEADLTKDGVNEKFEIFFTDSTFKDERELIISKKIDNKWEVWLRSKDVILGTEEGGVHGDPFESIEIIDSVLQIVHFGGSSSKWGYTKNFAMINDTLKLVYYEYENYNMCESIIRNTVDFITKKVTVEQKKNPCEGEEYYFKDLLEFKSTGYLLDGFNPTFLKPEETVNYLIDDEVKEMNVL